MTVCDESGKRYENEDVAEQFVKHFKELLGTKDTVYPFPVDDIVFKKKLSSDEAARMVRPVSEEVIKAAMFDMDDSKASGPDGFIVRFFEAAWNIVGKENKLMTQDKIAIWKPNEIMKKISASWNDIVEEMAKMNTNNNIWSIIKGLVFGAVIYFIWHERNTRLFKQCQRDEVNLVQLIKDTIKLRMMSQRIQEC
nr:hypothetical protein [Tanacetum cinerariifolium]